MVYTPSKLLSFEQFIAQYGDDSRYELADGELIEMEPTGPHETVGDKLAAKVSIAIDQTGQPWFIPRTCLLRPFAEAITARRPDIVVLDETRLADEPLWENEPVLTSGRSIHLVVEVVSSNWETDYARKVEEYALLGIPEYWIIDYKGLGGIAFIGRPKQPTFTVYSLVGEEYTPQLFRLGDPVISPTFPQLQLRLEDILPR